MQYVSCTVEWVVFICLIILLTIHDFSFIFMSIIVYQSTNNYANRFSGAVMPDFWFTIRNFSNSSSDLCFVPPNSQEPSEFCNYSVQYREINMYLNETMVIWKCPTSFSLILIDKVIFPLQTDINKRNRIYKIITNGLLELNMYVPVSILGTPICTFQHPLCPWRTW